MNDQEQGLFELNTIRTLGEHRTRIEALETKPTPPDLTIALNELIARVHKLEFHPDIPTPISLGTNFCPQPRFVSPPPQPTGFKWKWPWQK